MKVGDVCRCIKTFDGLVPGELTLQKNDIVQVHKIHDKIWSEGESSGGVGKFPSNCVIETELPDHKDDLPLYVAIADFTPLQPNDLPLKRGSFVVGLDAIDESWGYGESWGKKGVFPLNFVWKINKNLMENEESVELYGKVISSLKAQLPEELSLVIGDIIKITHFIDDTWCRGVCKGQTGIFPRNFVELVDDSEYIKQSLDKEDLNVIPEYGITPVVDSDPILNETISYGNKYTIDDDDSFLNDNYFKVNLPPAAIDQFAIQQPNLNPIEQIDKQDPFKVLSQEIDNYFDGKHSSQDKVTNLLDLSEDDAFSCTSIGENIGLYPYGRAIFSFKGQYENELSFSKGDIIQLTSHIDSHWTVGKLGNSSGIFPTSYIDIIIDCLFRPEENFTLRHQPLQEESIFTQPPVDVITSQQNLNEEEPSIDPNIATLTLDSDTVVKNENFSSKEALISSNDIIETEINHLEEVFPSNPNLQDSNICDPPEQEIIQPDVEKVSFPNDSKVKHPLTSAKAKSFPQDLKAHSIPNQADKNSNLDPLRPPPPLPLSFDKGEDDCRSLEIPNPVDIGSIAQDEQDPTPNETNKVCPKDENLSDSEIYAKQLRMRRELINELVTTEHEYIHDIESLIHVIKLGKNRKEAALVDFGLLMGNIEEVVKFAKNFLSKLHGTSFDDDESVQIGAIFLAVAYEMCDVYKIYSSNHSISAEQAIQKYQEGGEEAAEFLQWVLEELQQHKVNLMDMRAVLIKPIQRILKYPLFIDRLLESTPPSHSDFFKLQEAKIQMLNVAKEINDYTKRLSMVSKYRRSSTQSFSEVMHKVSMRSVTKKGSRFKTRLSATIGFLNQTKDLKFEKAEAKFQSTVNAASIIGSQGETLLHFIRARHSSELGIADGLASSLRGQSECLSKVKDAAQEAFTRLFSIFEQLLTSRVIEPMKQMLEMSEAPSRLIQKRYDKLVDFDTAQRRLDKNQDPSRTRILEEELSQAKSDYMALNTQLLSELPVFTAEALNIIMLALKSLVSIRMNLQGHLAKIYLKLGQSFVYAEEEDLSRYFRNKYGDILKSLRSLDFIPQECQPRSPKERRRSFRNSLERTLEGRNSGRSSLEKSKVRKVSQEKIPRQKTSEGIEPEKNLFVVNCKHAATEELELDLDQGAIVTVIKNKDPLGSSNRWFVDCQDKKGLVRASHLSLYERDIPNPDRHTSSSSQSSISHPNVAASESPSSSSTPLYSDPSCAAAIQEPGSMSVQDNPPKYEEIFPPCKNRYENEVFEEKPPPANPPLAHAYDLPPHEEESLPEDHIYEEVPEFFYALYNFGGSDENQLSLYQGQAVRLLLGEGDKWWLVENRDGESGYVPASYLSKYS